MSGGRKRVAWRRIANRSASIIDRLDVKAWRRQKKYSLNDREALMRKWVIGFCVTLFVLIMCSASERGIAYRSPILKWTGMLVCIPLTVMGFILGGIAWLMTGEAAILNWAVGMGFIGHSGVFRIFLGAAAVTIGLHRFAMWVGRKCSRSDESTRMFFSVLALFYLFAAMGIIGVFYRRCSAALAHTSAPTPQTTSAATAGVCVPESPEVIEGHVRKADKVAQPPARKFRLVRRKDIWPEEYESRLRADLKYDRSTHGPWKPWWFEYERVEVVNGKIVRPER